MRAPHDAPEKLDAWHGAMAAWQTRMVVGVAPLAAAALVGALIRAWWVAGDDVSVARWVMHTPSVLEDGQVWRLLTMGWVHQELPHVAINALWIAFAAWNLERAFGRLWTVGMFTLSVWVGGLASLVGNPVVPSLGASGGAFGLLGASIVLGFRAGDRLPVAHRLRFGAAIVPYVVVVGGSGLFASGVDNFAHFGGFAAGALLGAWVDPVGLQRRPNRNRRVAAGCVLGMLGVSGVLWTWGPSFVGRVQAFAPDHDVTFERPVAWTRAATPFGVGFRSASDGATNRFWTVRAAGWENGEHQSGLDAWLQRVHEAGWRSDGIAEQACAVGSAPGWCASGTFLRDDDALAWQWRGRHAPAAPVEAIWVSDAGDLARMAPLVRRLFASIDGPGGSTAASH